jgi:hypothetical protein
MTAAMRKTALLLTLLLTVAACAGDSDTGEASVSFGNLSDGDEVTSPVDVQFVAQDFTLEPAGDGAINEGAGHMHVMVDTDCVAVGEVIPGDDQHIHYGDGTDTAELELEPGEHTLCLQAGDGAHTALDLTDEVTITVVE